GARRDVARRAHRPRSEPALRPRRKPGDARLPPPDRVAELDFSTAPTRPARRARSRSTAPATRPASISSASERAPHTSLTMPIDYSQKIPNNGDITDARTLQRALEQWQPNFIQWWDDVGPDGSTNYD